ncbi:DUF732 domain-containing protein [Yinghuangia sp. YIM S09857]|uniref:DUF732 domain-containing protein n=1 Tax=Yinghuangia sp. YIM S09857 TaxID=3436929 RepID=UPI003F533217
MQRRVLTAAVGLVLTLSLTPLVTGCRSADANGRDDSAPGTADGAGEGSGGALPGSSGASGTPGPSGAAVPPNASVPSGVKSGKPSEGSSGAPSGLPPQPDTESRAAYAAALDAIDPRIVAGDPAGAVERGRTTCQAIAAHMNHTKLITQTKQKFARPGYTVTNAHAEAIVRAANTHLCPSSGA